MNPAEIYAAVSQIPEGFLKAAGVVAGGAGVGATYLWGRLRPARAAAAPVEPSPGRVALAPEDRDLVFTVVRTGTDLTKALHDHGVLLRGAFPASPPPPPPPPPAPRVRRVRTRS